MTGITTDQTPTLMASKWTIRRKLTFIITATSALGVLIAGMILFSYNILAFQKRFAVDMRVDALIVANNCKSSLAFNEPMDAQDVLRSLRASPEIAEAFVYRADGTVFGAYSRVGAAKPWAAPAVQDGGFLYEPFRVLVFQQVRLGNEVIGTVCLSFGRERFFSFVRRSVLWLFIVVLGTIAFSAALATGLQRIVSGPIRELARVAQTITGTRDYSVRAKKRRNDELGQLSDAFNSMLEQIQEQDAALRFTQFSVDHSADGAFWMSSDGRFVYVNQAACDSLGYSREQLLTMSVHDIDPEFPPKAWLDHWENLCENHSLTFDSLHRTQDGTDIPVEVTANFVEFEGKEYNCAFVRNVSEQRRVQAALRASEERFRSIFENAVMGIYRITPTGRLLMANQALARMLGYDSPEELTSRYLEGDGVSEFSLRSAFEQAARGKQVVGLESEWKRRDGSILHVSQSARVVCNETGKPLYLDGTVEDISNRKQAEEELRTRERFLACLSDVSQHLISETVLENALPAILGALGFTAKVSRTYLFANHVGANGEIRCSLVSEWCREPLHSRTGTGSLEDVPYVDHGLSRWVDVLSSGGVLSGDVEDLPESERERLEPHQIQSLLLIPLFVEGKWYGYIGFDDCEKTRAWSPVEVDLLQVAAAEISSALENERLLTQLRDHAANLEERVAARTAELTAVNKELEAFSYSVSHDLRAPLRSVDGFSQALLDDFGDDLEGEAKDYLHRVRAAAQKMGQLIDDLLRLSRLTRREMVFEDFDLALAARSIEEELRDRYPGQEVELIVANDLAVTGDPDLLHIVMENLLGNAWKFTQHNEHARVVVGAADTSDGRVFFIRDNGAGFEMRYAEKLFGAFQRLHSADEFEGTGIGLATVKRIIVRHGGKIWAEAEVGKGATFNFTLGQRRDS
jgi:PAS domain S-box-containing protein